MHHAATTKPVPRALKNHNSEGGRPDSHAIRRQNHARNAYVSYSDDDGIMPTGKGAAARLLGYG